MMCRRIPFEISCNSPTFAVRCIGLPKHPMLAQAAIRPQP
jgi:hypothetical protein